MTKKLITLLLVLFLYVTPCGAFSKDGTTYTTNGSQSDVQAAVNDANSGDTVTLPASGEGVITWSTPVTLPSARSIILQGAGVDTTYITDGTGNTFGSGSAIVAYVAGSTFHDISGITFVQGSGATATEGTIFINVSGSANGNNFRIHHCKFKNLYRRGIKIYNGVYGLIDNCTFLAPYNASAQGVSIFGTGSTSWGTASSFGAADAVYIEDCTFTYSYLNDGALDAYNGARYVIRYSTITDTLVGHHGADSGGFRSCKQWEIYENDFLCPDESANCVAWFGSRGGTGVVYNNTVTGEYGHDYCNLNNYRSTASYPVWGQCDGSNAYDLNYRELAFTSGGTYEVSAEDTITGATSEATATVKEIRVTSGTWAGGDAAGYLYLLSQSGTFQSENLNVGANSNVATISANSSAPTGYACMDSNGRGTDQVLDPVYEWGNTVNGVTSAEFDVLEAGTGEAQGHVLENRDFFNNTEKPAYSAYTYPHPLAGADETAPTISGAGPTGEQYCTSDPRDITLYWTTSEICNCRIDSSDLGDYDDATADSVTNTDSTSHSDVESFACDGSYNRYVYCEDPSGNESSLTTISFSVGEEANPPGGAEATNIGLSGNASSN